jgi:CHAT domain-containing protein/cytochrome c-type biogenesis protein CcmH/NrfG
LAAPGQPGWIRIKDRDCYLWEANPMAGESIIWTGECENGFATGGGKALLFTASGASSNQLEGAAVDGKLEGEIAVTYPDGSRYVGKLNSSGLRSGFGTFTYPTGLIEKGYFIDGEFVGQENRDTSDLKLIEQQCAQALGARHLKDAEALCQSEIDLLTKRFGPTHWRTAAKKVVLARIYIIDNTFGPVEDLLHAAMGSFDRYLGEDNINDGAPLIELGNLYLKQYRYSDAEISYQHALRIEQHSSGNNNINIIYCLTGLAEAYLRQARYDDSETSYKKALNTATQYVGTDSASITAAVLKGLASLYDMKGRYSEAALLLNRSLATIIKTDGEDSLSTAFVLQELGRFYQHTESYGKAELVFRRALGIHEKVGDGGGAMVLEDLTELAETYLLQGRYLEAEILLKRALSIDSQDFIALLSLGQAYYQQGRQPEAEATIEQSLNTERKRRGENQLEMTTILNSLAELYSNERRYDYAKMLINQGITIREQILGKDNIQLAYSWIALAHIYEAQARYAEAVSLYKDSLHKIKTTLGDGRPSEYQLINALTKVYIEWGHIAEALPLLDGLIATKQIMPYIGYQTILSAQKAYLVTNKKAFDTTYAIRQLERTAASLAVARLSQRLATGSSRLAHLIRRDQDLATESGRLDKNLVDAASKPLDQRYAQGEEEMRKRLADIAAEREALQSTLAKEFPSYTGLAQPQPLTLSETQAMLDDDEAIVSFYFDEQKGYAWTVTRTEGFWTEIPTNAKQLNEQVQQLRSSLTFNADVPFDAKLAYEIYQQTFGPIAETIAGKKRLSIIANGALTSIPLGVLVTKDPAGKTLKDTDWLIKTFAVTVEPSISSIKTLRAKERITPAPKPMIAFADPVFSQKARNQTPPARITLRSMPEFYQGTQIDVRTLGDALPQLPGTRSEVKAVARSVHADSGDLKLGPDATTIAVKDTPLDQYRVVYFATHSLVAGDPEKFAKAEAEPALVLSIPEKPTELDDGLLRASDIAQLKLNADWVVLSACNTASSDGVGAEALSGLAQAFIYAGARSLVVSHWDVSDDASAKIMSALFAISSSQPDLSHGQALQAAEIQLLNAAETDAEAHPRYWAPFDVVGEPAKTN